MGGRKLQDSDVNPVAHSLTDAYALIGTIAAIDILDYLFMLFQCGLKLDMTLN